MAVVTHAFTFDTPERAARFVLRVRLALPGAATYRDGCTAYVVTDGRVDELARLARESGANLPAAKRDG